MHDYADKTRGIRLQKAIANAGVASRRDCEELITAGRVTVNGQKVDQLPAWVDPTSDRVEVDGQPIPKKKPSRYAHAGKTYIMLHKPRHVISTTDDDQGRRTVLDLIDLPRTSARPPRLFPVGRLDADSTGLILLTDDGPLTQGLTHPSHDVPKRYRVSIRGKISDDELERLRKGLYLAHRGTGGKDARQPSTRKASMSEVRRLRTRTDRSMGDQTELSIELHEGQNREIRRMLARLGFDVRRLRRVAIGPLQLKGLSTGRWRMLTGDEVAALYKAAGLKRVKPKPNGKD